MFGNLRSALERAVHEQLFQNHSPCHRRWGEHGRELRGLLGISLQETQFSEKLTVGETIELFRSFYPRGPTPEAIIGMVQLQEKTGSRVGQLSGGQKQRLALACALVGDPELLFLDEPTTGLDPQSRRQLWELIEGFKSDGRSILLTTHYMEEAERLCNHIAIMDEGRIIAMGTLEQLLALRDQNREVQRPHGLQGLFIQLTGKTLRD